MKTHFKYIERDGKYLIIDVGDVAGAVSVMNIRIVCETDNEFDAAIIASALSVFDYNSSAHIKEWKAIKREIK